MAANKSRGQLAAILRRRRLRTLDAFQLGLFCPPCHRTVRRAGRDLARRWPDVRLGELLLRARCAECGRRMPDAWVEAGDGRIAVMGHGTA